MGSISSLARLFRVGRFGFTGCEGVDLGVDFVDRGDLSTGVLFLFSDVSDVLPKIFDISVFISFTFLQNYGKLLLLPRKKYVLQHILSPNPQISELTVLKKLI
jgi:hypothetical protein